jgi:hypothetical protein
VHEYILLTLKTNNMRRIMYAANDGGAGGNTNLNTPTSESGVDFSKDHQTNLWAKLKRAPRRAGGNRIYVYGVESRARTEAERLAELAMFKEVMESVILKDGRNLYRTENGSDQPLFFQPTGQNGREFKLAFSPANPVNIKGRFVPDDLDKAVESDVRMELKVEDEMAKILAARRLGQIAPLSMPRANNAPSAGGAPIASDLSEDELNALIAADDETKA